MTGKKASTNPKIHTTDIMLIVKKKADFFNDVVQRTILHVQRNKQFDILGISEVNSCIDSLGLISKQILEVIESSSVNNDSDELINKLQLINNELSGLLRIYGTDSLDDLLLICFGGDIKPSDDQQYISKLDLLKKYFHPVSYKIVNMKDEVKLKKCQDESLVDEYVKNLDCFELATSYKQFHMRVYGVKLYVCNSNNKGLIIHGVLDDVIVEFLNNSYITAKHKDILDTKPIDVDTQCDMFDNFMSSLSLKDYLICGESIIHSKYAGYLSQCNSIRNRHLSQIVKEFIVDDMFTKRTTLIQLLLKTSSYENQYLAYLLYDLLSNESNGNIDTQEQVVIFDSFPSNIKKLFKLAMKRTIKYTNELSNFDVNKIPIEQQICLMNAPDSVKEKAMIKLKEIKSKSDDSGSKSRQYLEGLLKIPFGIYRREKMLDVIDETKTLFKEICRKNPVYGIPQKESYSYIEILKYVNMIKGITNVEDKLSLMIEHFIAGDKAKLIHNIHLLNDIALVQKVPVVKTAGVKKDQLQINIQTLLGLCGANNELFVAIEKCYHEQTQIVYVNNELELIRANIGKMINYTAGVKKTLDSKVHGHTKAKRQIERVIGQWMNGEPTGYCLGFEGNPGVGKTTLAKGLSECLTDADGNARPFALIAVGGDSNASTIIGHSFTYVGSIWGQLVQILMDKKCMNPVILIDEIDKISKTEHGKELIGVFTHLLDKTQNTHFQDKYFAGVDIDMSKVLFILSYNDPESIDKIMLDRVHRIQFESLTIDDKIVIAKEHILPELYKDIGLDNMVYFSDATIRYIIDNYTMEPGVRKLKEKFFEIVGELNLNVLSKSEIMYELPIEITVDSIKNEYFKGKREVRIQKIHSENRVGVINCLWANVYNIGGILSASASFFPSDKYLSLSLTGLLDKMMEESFQISLTNAYNLLDNERKIELNALYNGAQKYGIHMHMGDGSVSKSGTSAGIAITILLYSLLTGKKIKYDFAVTGEASDLNGKVGEIGALATKITYGIKSGVRNFIFPEENRKDFDDFKAKNENTDLIQGVQFYPIKHIDEALKLIIDV
jgi:ATP-dependent Lon protease